MQVGVLAQSDNFDRRDYNYQHDVCGAILMYAGVHVAIVDSVYNNNVVYGHAPRFCGEAIFADD